MSNSPPPDFNGSWQRYWENPYADESDNESQADVTTSAMSEDSSKEAAAAATKTLDD